MTKLDPSGSALSYSTFVGEGDADVGLGVAVDGREHAYVTGWTLSSDFPTTPGAYDETYNGGSDAFVTELDPSGSTLSSSTFLGGGNVDAGRSVAVDRWGHAYFTGYTISSDFPTTPGAPDETHNGGIDAFVTKLDPSGSSLSSSTFLGGKGNDVGLGVAVDGRRNADVTGSTSSSDFPTTPGAYDETYNGGIDAFVTKVDPSGLALAYSTFLGGGSQDEGVGVAVDGRGNAHITGFTTSSDFPTTPGAYDETSNGGVDTFVTRLDNSGSSLSYSTFLGGEGNDYGEGVAVDGRGNAYITGHTNSFDFPITPEAYDQTYNGNTDAFLTKLNIGDKE